MREKIDYNHQLIYHCLYSDQNKYDSIININLILYITHVSADLLISNKWFFCKKYNVVFITDDMNVDEQINVFKAFNKNLFLKKLTSMNQKFSNILIKTIILIDIKHILTRAFHTVLMKLKWLIKNKNQYVKWI